MLELNLKLLNYDQLWLDCGILTEDLLRSQIIDFQKGEDCNAEHYRHGTFLNFINAQSSMSNDLIYKLFEIVKIETDISLRNVTALDILKLKTLNQIQFELVSSLIKVIIGDNMQKYIDREISWKDQRL